MNTRTLGRVLVTGADGFIGSHLVERLIAEGCEVTALCLYNSFGTHGHLDDLVSSAPKNLRVVHGDVRDPTFLNRTTPGHATIFHLAALIAIPYSYIAPQSYFETNTLGTLHVCEAALRSGVTRLVHTSTSEVYGTAQRVPIDETHPLVGQSPYSASKIGADMVVESYVRSFSLPAITLRPFNTYGPRQSLRAVIPAVAAQMLAGSKVIKLGNVTPTRDFNFVTDTVDAFVRTATHAADTCVGQVFNAGSGREISIRDLVSLLASTIGTDAVVEQDNERTRPDASEVERLLADSTKLQKETGYAPRVSLEEGLSRVIAWLRVGNRIARAAHYHV